MVRKNILLLFSIVWIYVSLPGNAFSFPDHERLLKEALENSRSEELIPAVRERVAYSAVSLRDPFQAYYTPQPIDTAELHGSAGASEHVLPLLTLRGIVRGEDGAYAIINDRIVQAGDSVEGVRILGIDKNGVSLFYHSQRYSLPAPIEAYSRLIH